MGRQSQSSIVHYSTERNKFSSIIVWVIFAIWCRQKWVLVVCNLNVLKIILMWTNITNSNTYQGNVILMWFTHPNIVSGNASLHLLVGKWVYCSLCQDQHNKMQTFLLYVDLTDLETETLVHRWTVQNKYIINMNKITHCSMYVCHVNNVLVFCLTLLWTTNVVTSTLVLLWLWTLRPRLRGFQCYRS